MRTSQCAGQAPFPRDVAAACPSRASARICGDDGPPGAGKTRTLSWRRVQQAGRCRWDDAAMTDRIEPFMIGVDSAALDDLGDRLRRARWPERETVGDWSQGVPLGYLQDLCGYWASRYDWRGTEARMNQIPQFTTRIDGLDRSEEHT